MRLILFRHGPAGTRDVSRWPDDDLRPLTSKGEQRTREAAEGMARLVKKAVVLTSPLTRAEQTARILDRALDGGKIEELAALAPGGSARALFERLGKLGPDDTAILVGHEPDLGQLAGTLLFDASAGLPLKKAGACAIDFEGAVRRRSGTLVWFLGPQVLRRLAGGKNKP